MTIPHIDKMIKGYDRCMVIGSVKIVMRMIP